MSEKRERVVEVPLPWASHGPTNAHEGWQWERRKELAGLAVPLTIALLRDETLQPAGGGEDWRGLDVQEQAAREAAILERAARLAAGLQDALDRARPRS